MEFGISVAFNRMLTSFSSIYIFIYFCKALNNSTQIKRTKFVFKKYFESELEKFINLYCFSICIKPLWRRPRPMIVNLNQPFYVLWYDFSLSTRLSMRYQIYVMIGGVNGHSHKTCIIQKCYRCSLRLVKFLNTKSFIIEDEHESNSFIENYYFYLEYDL